MTRRGLRTSSSFAILAAFAALSACGGDGGGSPTPSPTPTPANRPPAFTSPAGATAPENSIVPFYTATASDPDGNALTFSIAGGIDQAAFRITAGGALSFAAPPDFEMPADSDRNNVYLVRLGVSDGQTSATLDVSVTVTNGGTDAFRVTRVGTGFNQPLFVAPVPDGSGRVFVVEKTGLIRILNPESGAIASVPFLDVSASISTDGERGLLGLATASDFATTGTFYVQLTNPAGDVEIRRYRTLPGNRDRGDPTTGDAILSIPHPGFSNHNGGWIAFGPDNLLYAAVGDGGGSGDPGDNAQDRSVLLGKLLRIDPSRDDYPGDGARDYAIPTGNPFTGFNERPEIWAYGLRNPFRNSFDSVTGLLYLADVGQNAIEEVDLMRPQDGGANFGWPFREGTRAFSGTPSGQLVPPVTEYAHGSGPLQGESITGGYVYRGRIEALNGLYIFGDFVNGNLWSVPAASLALGSTLPSSAFTVRNSDFAPAAGAINNVASFGVDQSGNLYIVDFDGEIFRLGPT